MTSLDDLIAQQKAQIENFETDDLNIVMAGQLVPLKITALLPSDWSMVVAANPPRRGAARDKNLGMNTNTLPADYPAVKITVNGETVDQEKWRSIYAVLDSINRENVATVMWGLNVWAAMQKLTALGKARAGETSTKRNTRSRSASPRAAGKAGNPPKSPRSSTTRKAD